MVERISGRQICVPNRCTPGKHLARLVQPMTEFNELQSTNDYLVSELILARQTNDLMTENNRRLENLLIKCIKDLQDCNRVIDDMKLQFDELSESVINLNMKRVKRMLQP